MDNSIKRCQVHNEESDIFCDTCGRISCPMCRSCGTHEKLSVEEFVKKNEAHLKSVYLKDYQDAAKKASEKFAETVAHNNETISTSEEKAKELQNAITNSDEVKAKDLKLILETTEHLRGAQVVAFTDVLKEAVEEAIHTLDVSEKIEAELSKYKPELARQEALLSNIKQQTSEYTWLLKLLDTITKAGGDELDEDVKLATSLCFAGKVIDRIGMSSAISDFKAFPSVCEVFDIKKVMEQGLTDVGNGVKVSKPINVRKGLEVGDHILSSLSHNGIMAVNYLSKGFYVQLTDLVGGKNEKVKVEDATHTAFYDDSMVMLTDGMPLRSCSVEKMFSKKNVNALKTIGSVQVEPYTDVSLFNSTRKLVFANQSHIPYEYNVDTDYIYEVAVDKKIYSFGSLTGIKIGVKGVFMEAGSDPLTYALTNGNWRAPVLEFACRFMFAAFIPSSSDPNNLKKGIKVFTSGGFFTDSMKEGTFVKPFKFNSTQSIVRLYQDVFLALNEKSKKWCLVRIVVP